MQSIKKPVRGVLEPVTKKRKLADQLAAKFLDGAGDCDFKIQLEGKVVYERKVARFALDLADYFKEQTA